MQFTPTNCTLITAQLKTETRRPITDQHEFDGASLYRINKNGRRTRMYRVGDTYSLQPGRGQRGYPGVRLLVTKIVPESLHDITDEGGHAEGYQGREGFRKVWEALYPKGEFIWSNNPRVAVIKFKLIKDAKA